MKRILLKISGESLSKDGISIHPDKALELVNLIQEIQSLWHELVIVLGWWNIYRGSSLIKAWVDPADSHNMSMLSTVFNGVTLKNFLEKIGIQSVVMDALQVEFLESYSAIRAREYLKAWKVVICTSGWGTPFFTTDTTWVLRALELHCEAVFKLTQVDGVYDCDPKTHPDAQRFDTISYNDFLKKDLKVLDQTAIIMARDNMLPLFVAELSNTENIIRVIQGSWRATKIS